MRRRTHTAGAVAIVLILASATTIRADSIHVPGDYDTIQAAIDAAADGDEIIVAPGTYNESIDYHGKAIEVRSTDGPEATIISPATPTTAVTFANGENEASILAGFTVTNGSPACDDECVARGILVDGTSPRIENCVVTGNRVRQEYLAGGAGMLIQGGHPSVSSVHFVNNAVEDPDQGRGGAVEVQAGSPTFTACSFVTNSVIAYCFAFGGAVAIAEGAQVAFIGCDFDGNLAHAESSCGGTQWGFGGAVFVQGGATFSGDTFSENFAAATHPIPCLRGRGGAIWVDSQQGAAASLSGVWVKRNAISFNEDPFCPNPDGGALEAVAPGSLFVANSAFCDNFPQDLWGSGIVDGGGNTSSDACPCHADVNGDGSVDTTDLLVLLGGWDTSAGDVNGDGTTDTTDLLLLLGAWGPCL